MNDPRLHFVKASVAGESHIERRWIISEDRVYIESIVVVVYRLNSSERILDITCRSRMIDTRLHMAGTSGTTAAR
jgi:hypothetical protein